MVVLFQEVKILNRGRSKRLLSDVLKLGGRGLTQDTGGLARKLWLISDYVAADCVIWRHLLGFVHCF